MRLSKYFKNKKILVTGHTGFKGSWLVAWLKTLKANVVGVSLNPSTDPSHFEVANLKNNIDSIILDIRNYDSIKELILNVQPDYVFHLAAQALVRDSYEDPIKTWNTNLNGTINILDSLRNLKKKCVAVLITSDKCYDNVEWHWGYREIDRLGGEDPYSASKGATEIAIRSYVKSFFSKEKSLVRIGSARAGNVIGGGDWSKNRIIPDCVKAWSKGKMVDLRNPEATRPWQHVLEPLSGYLTQAMALNDRQELHGESFNFGPNSTQNNTVRDLVENMANHWDKVKWRDVSLVQSGPYESGLLKLNCDKALHLMDWQAVMNFEETLKMTVQWYRSFYKSPSQSEQTTLNQIQSYTELAKNKSLVWTK